MKKTIKILLFISLFSFLFWFFQNKKNNEEKLIIDNHTDVALEAVDEVQSNKSSETDKSEKEESGEFDHHLNSLPTIADLQKLSFEEVHHTPEAIRNGGELLGKIHDEAEEDETKRAGAMSFFKACAENNEIATPIRAVCLSKIYKLIPEWKIPLSLSHDKISKEVEELALRLP